MPPSLDPDLGLFYVNATRGYSVTYLTDTDERPEGYGGAGRGLWTQHVLEAIDCQTGKIRWSHPYPTVGGAGLGGPGILSTAGKVLFTGDYSGNLIAYASDSGKALWHFRMTSSLGNGPMSYEMNGTQYLVAGAGDTLYAFALVR
jgi:glucose dehydrogenase